MGIVKIDHVQLAMPRGGEDRAREFYGRLLEIPEVQKRGALVQRGGVWFQRDDVKVDLGVEVEFRAALKAHPAFLVRDLEELVQRLRTAGVEVIDDGLLPGYRRVHVTDPFGNRLELMERKE